MNSFISLVWIGGTSLVTMLIWRLYVAVETQHNLEVTLTENSETLETERQELRALMESQTATIEALTAENLILKQRSKQDQLRFGQLQADHQALQEKYSELEQDLLKNIASSKTLSEHLQMQKLAQARLHRQVESVQEHQSLQEQEQQTLRQQHQQVTDKNQLYQKAVQAAKAKIESLTREKKQLERDLQQALYRIVTLEQHQQSDDDLPAQSVMMSSITMPEASEPSLPRFG